jgi:hypothetical protein
MWITTSQIYPNVIVPGYRFNATVWLRIHWNVSSYSITMLYNSTQLRCTRAGFTASTSSDYMAGHGRTALWLSIDGHGKGTIVAEEWYNSMDIPGPHTGSLIWAEFEALERGRSTLAIDPQTWVSDSLLNYVYFVANNCTIDLNR